MQALGDMVDEGLVQQRAGGEVDGAQRHLRALDVDFIKIDGSFVQDMASSPLSAEVVGSITRIAHLLDKKTIAEHTESDAVRAALAALGVDYAQGYAIDHPQPLKAYLAGLVREPVPL